MTEELKAVEDRAPEYTIARVLASRLRDARVELTNQWLDRINERVALATNEIFPSDELLDHVPLLIDGIAAYVESPAADLVGDTAVVAKAMELGALRHAQGFDAYEILKEYEIFGGILFTFFVRAVDTIEVECGKAELMECAASLFRAVTMVQQATMMDFLRLAGEKIGERENRLRAFNQMASHEMKNRIGAIMGASELLEQTPDLAASEHAQMVAIIARNAKEMSKTVATILELTDVEKDARQHRHVGLAEAVNEGVRQVRETARRAQVEVRIGDIPSDVEVDAAVVELCIANYLSNAIKYADHSVEQPLAEITAAIEAREDGEKEVVVRVSDNGIGVPVERRDRLFERFFRAHQDVADVEGTGLGLSIVRTTAESHGGRAWAEFKDKGSVFVLALPLRRQQDRGEPG